MSEFRLHGYTRSVAVAKLIEHGLDATASAGGEAKDNCELETAIRRAPQKGDRGIQKIATELGAGTIQRTKAQWKRGDDAVSKSQGVFDLISSLRSAHQIPN